MFSYILNEYTFFYILSILKKKHRKYLLFFLKFGKIKKMKDIYSIHHLYTRIFGFNKNFIETKSSELLPILL